MSAPRLPFAWAGGDTGPLTPRQRSANYEAMQLQQRETRTPRRRKPADPDEARASAMSLRDELIRACSPPGHEGPMRDPAAMELVDRFEAALRDAWELIERRAVEREARQAIAEALERIGSGQLF